MFTPAILGKYLANKRLIFLQEVNFISMQISFYCWFFLRGAMKYSIVGLFDVLLELASVRARTFLKLINAGVSLKLYRDKVTIGILNHWKSFHRRLIFFELWCFISNNFILTKSCYILYKG